MQKLFALGLVYVALSFAQSIGRPLYVIAPKDQILVRAPGSKKLNGLDGRIFQVDSDGFVNLPSIGRVRAGGRTLDAFEKELSFRLKKNSSDQPQVSVSEVATRH
jgi:protein involved in polysaccharide export with SLBB domain